MSLTYPSNKICPRCKTVGYVWYMDNSEFVAKCINCGHYFHKGDFPMCVLDGETKRMTWGDKIRSMTDEELAEFLETVNSCSCSFVMGKSPCVTDGCPCWYNWLKQEV